MAFIEIRADLHRLVEQWTRVADALERLSPVPREQRPPKPIRFIHVDPAAIADAEDEAERQREAGTEGVA